MTTGPQRIILIGSGRYEYAEVELAGALQIVGPNNTGKTTLINTLQFLYLDDRRHMDFGSYTPEQTREFYFPTQYSYILFECLGVTGQCVIGWRGQSKTSGGEPERFCYAGPYAAEDYLEETRRVREPRDVSSRLALKQFRVIKGAQEQKELLLPPSGNEGRGLGIVALREPDKYHHFRETLKNLLTLSAITQEQMRDRLLMLADLPPEKLAFDSRELFGDDYDRIRARREQLAKFKQHQALVERLVGRHAEREIARGELVWRWTDLRVKRQTFEAEQTARLARLRDERAALEKKVRELAEELTDRRDDVQAFSVQKGQLLAPLKTLEIQDREFKDFPEELERAGLANLRREITQLEMQLAGAEGESREKARQKVDFFSERVADKENTIHRFDRLAVTLLRQHFKDDELSVIFRILNRELLELPVGGDGVEITRQPELLAALRGLLAAAQAGIYRDANVSFPLPKAGEPLAGLENLETARALLADYQATLKRWQDTLAAIEQREKIAVSRQSKLGEVAVREKRLFQFGEYQTAKAGEPRLRAELKKIEASLAAASERIVKLAGQHAAAGKATSAAADSIRKQEDDFNKITGDFDTCIFPEFAAQPRPAEGVPNDFAAAIALFLRQQERQYKLGDEIANLLAQTEQWLGDEFHGADESETIGSLQAELEALPEKEDALARDWNAHIHGLKATFDMVLKNLGHVRSAATSLNRAFDKVQVSNLKAVRLEVVEQSDLVSWIKRLAEFEPGGLFEADPRQESAIKNFRQKIQNSPVIRFTDLFTLAFTVTGADDQRHTYHNFRQIESEGTTITIKVLFNLLLLKSQLRSDGCAVPFFLDEIQTLDADNRRAILQTARQLGFIAITAAPQAVSEVDAIYFLQPQKGRIILRHKHRVTVKHASPVSPP